MKKEFSLQYIMGNRGCQEMDEIKSLHRAAGSPEVITIQNILRAAVSTRNKYWFVIRKCDLTIEQKQKIAIDVAEMVLPIYEKRYPENKAPREAIEAARSYLAGHISIDQLLEKRHDAAATAAAAAAAAYAAADAAAAYAAADAAAAAAAYAAADAAAAYAAAAYAAAAADAAAADDAAYAADADDAAYAADADDAIKQQLYDYLVKFCEEN